MGKRCDKLCDGLPLYYRDRCAGESFAEPLATTYAETGACDGYSQLLIAFMSIHSHTDSSDIPVLYLIDRSFI